MKQTDNFKLEGRGELVDSPPSQRAVHHIIDSHHHGSLLWGSPVSATRRDRSMTRLSAKVQDSQVRFADLADCTGIAV